MPKKSAGILWYRFQNNQVEVFLVHPGGPFWAKKDQGTWSIPKGEFEESEDPLSAAKREMHEETGIDVNLHPSEYSELDPVRQKSGKVVFAWAAQGDFDPSSIDSNSFEMEWPPKSGKTKSFPEVDKAEWFGLTIAKEKIVAGQAPLISQLETLLKSEGKL
ncbi:MAG TPA: NUDIX domain-containing protein [Hanamia sp.]|nr:NUDIX domain-containing protein [Hanamia sp.]